MAKYYLNNTGRLTLEIEGAELKYGAWFSNWSGKTEGKFHWNKIDPETGIGYRYFTVKLPSEITNEDDGQIYTIEDLKAMGLPIKTFSGDPERGWDDENTLKVSVSYKFTAPVVKVTVHGKTEEYSNKGDHIIDDLDSMAYEAPDLVLSFGRMNPNNGKRSCYLKEFYSTAVTSRMSLKHMAKEESADNVRYVDAPYDPDED